MAKYTLADSLGAIALCILFAPIEWFMMGWTLTKLWGWFIVRTFDVAPLTWAQAMGVALVFGFLIRGVAKVDLSKDEPKSLSGRVARSAIFGIAMCLAFILAGWVLNFFY